VKDVNVISVNASSAVPAGPPVSVDMPNRDHSRQDEATKAAIATGEDVKRMIDEMQSNIKRMNVSLTFSTYGDRGEKVAVIVSDDETGEVIREIPAKEIQNLYGKMSELAGIIFNRQI
jgi:flagellar protein FlaG